MCSYLTKKAARYTEVPISCTVPSSYLEVTKHSHVCCPSLQAPSSEVSTYSYYDRCLSTCFYRVVQYLPPVIPAIVTLRLVPACSIGNCPGWLQGTGMCSTHQIPTAGPHLHAPACSPSPLAPRIHPALDISGACSQHHQSFSANHSLSLRDCLRHTSTLFKDFGFSHPHPLHSTCQTASID